MVGHVFISYSHKDKNIMQRIDNFLNDNDVKTWVDTKGLRPGTPLWSKDIDKAIRESSALIVILTPDSRISDFVEKEIYFAQMHDIDIYPILAKGNEKKSIPLILALAQYIDIRKIFSEPMISILSELRGSVQRKLTQKPNVPIFKASVINTKDNQVVEKLEKFVKFYHPRLQHSDNDGNYPLYGQNGIIKSVDEFEFEGLFILIPRVGFVLKKDSYFSVQIVEGKFSASQAVFILQIKNVDIAYFLKAVIESYKPSEFTHSTGSQPYISLSALKQLPITLPQDLDERNVYIGSVSKQFREIERVKKIITYQSELADQLEHSIKNRMFNS